jgi:hypothetical protein
MQSDLFLKHLYGTKMSRRQAMRAAARAGVAAGAAAALGTSAVTTQTAAAAPGKVSAMGHTALASAQEEPLDDVMFDIGAVEAGAWVPGPYGPGDQRGTFNEVTPEKTAAALALLDTSRPVVTYNLGERMFNGFPAFRTNPPRLHEQQLAAFGVPAPEGAVQLGAEPIGPNRLTFLEERLNSPTFQIATQLDNLNHIGLGDMYYNGFRYSEFARPWGTAALGNEHMGPMVTRGILLDIVGLKASQGETSAYFTAADGAPVLQDMYRITLEDMLAALEWEGIAEPGPGDVVLFRTGWTHLVRTDPERYLASEPGIYLREARYLAARRPAIVGGDTWGLEVLDPQVTGGHAFPVHQVLIMQHGIRIGEGVVTDRLAEDGVFEFVYLVTPQNAEGATAGNTPPAALGQPRQAAAAQATTI